MQLIILMSNGQKLAIEKVTVGDFEMLSDNFSNFKKYFIWNDSVWVRKSDVSAFWLVADPVVVPAQTAEEVSVTQ